MKHFSFPSLLILLLAVNLSYAQLPHVQRVKVLSPSNDYTALQTLGLPIEEAWVDKDKQLVFDLDTKEVGRIRALGYPVEVIVEDLSEYYRTRALKAQEKMKTTEYQNFIKSTNVLWPVPAGFELGSMGGFYTWEEMKTELDNMAQLYPGLITVKAPASATSSIEGRPLFYVKISDNPNTLENEPRVLYTGMHHAREPIGMQLLIYYMYYLLENYATDSLVQYIVDNTELYFLPVMNPDGYLYNEQTNPLGGGNWRKNRRLNPDGSYGVDLNRNYGYMWGIDNQGSSPDPSQETYRGNSAFSEPETQAVREFCQQHSFNLALNYHSFSNLLLYPWGYTSQSLTPHHDLFHAFAKALTQENHYLHGPGSTTIYQTNGGSDDWMYGEQQEKPLIFSYTPEVGDGMAGFWPSPELIIPLCQQNMWQNLQAALLVNQYAVVKDVNPVFIPSQSYLKYEVRNLGLQTGNFSVSIQSLGNAFQSLGPPNQHNNLSGLQVIMDSIPYTLAGNVTAGQLLHFTINITNGSWHFSDTVTKFHGSPITLFLDSCNDLGNWTGSWATTNSSYHSPVTSITDTPSGNYLNNSFTSITLSANLNLTSCLAAVLSFWAKWDLEPGYDYVQVKVSSNGGASWTPLQGTRTHPGGSEQLPGQPLYDGFQGDWVKEEVDLSAYAGQQIKLRFSLASDGGLTADGFYFDDVEIKGLFPVGVGDQPEKGPVLGGPFPNPARTSVVFTLDNGHAALGPVLAFYRPDGKLLRQEKLWSSASRISLEGWKPGVYFFTLLFEGRLEQAGKLVVMP